MSLLLRRLSDLVPPIVKRRLNPYGFEGRFDSFESALCAVRGKGYEQRELCEWVARRTAQYRDDLTTAPLSISYSEAFLLLAIAESSNVDKRLTVLDFGGAAGAHFFCARSAFPKLSLQWHVIETPCMVEASRSLEGDGLSFGSSLESEFVKRTSFDLIVSSGALQYTSEPLTLLQRLLDLKSPRIVLMRTGLSDEPDPFVTVQRSPLTSNGPGRPLALTTGKLVRYPVVFVPYQAFERCLGTRYSIYYRIKEPVNYEVGLTRVPSFSFLATLI